MIIKYFTTLLLLTLFIDGVTAQEKAPEAVRKTFAEKYPGENDPDWHKDSNGNYESNFKIDGESLRADFSPNGKWIETERSIKKDDLPKLVKDVINKYYSGWEIAEIEEVDHHKKGRFYDVEFKQKGKNKDVEIKPDGTVIN